MPSAPPAVKGVAKTLAQHHKAVIGFLLGFFLVLLLYTFLSGQLVSSEDAIVRAVTQQSTPAVHTDQDGRTTSPTSPTSTSSNTTQGMTLMDDDYMIEI
ncbi:hypothetical protein OsI_22966 [Oryza sativa Indica Group]|uniref:Uncharacterized protein n=1 Tax=Oryza sativa subsp. indica TaxID=39946 RepID=A2YCX5_ORYSI|nr:hypothetical protein OsI_22966 [Oryza sativa Indica Group]